MQNALCTQLSQGDAVWFEEQANTLQNIQQDDDDLLVVDAKPAPKTPPPGDPDGTHKAESPHPWQSIDIIDDWRLTSTRTPTPTPTPATSSPETQRKSTGTPQIIVSPVAATSVLALLEGGPPSSGGRCSPDLGEVLDGPNVERPEVDVKDDKQCGDVEVVVSDGVQSGNTRNLAVAQPANDKASAMTTALRPSHETADDKAIANDGHFKRSKDPSGGMRSVGRQREPATTTAVAAHDNVVDSQDGTEGSESSEAGVGDSTSTDEENNEDGEDGIHDFIVPDDAPIVYEDDGDVTHASTKGNNPSHALPQRRLRERPELPNPAAVLAVDADIIDLDDEPRRYTTSPAAAAAAAHFKRARTSQVALSRSTNLPPQVTLSAPPQPAVSRLHPPPLPLGLPSPVPLDDDISPEPSPLLPPPISDTASTTLVTAETTSVQCVPCPVCGHSFTEAELPAHVDAELNAQDCEMGAAPATHAPVAMHANPLSPRRTTRPLVQAPLMPRTLACPSASTWGPKHGGHAEATGPRMRQARLAVIRTPSTGTSRHATLTLLGGAGRGTVEAPTSCPPGVPRTQTPSVATEASARPGTDARRGFCIVRRSRATPSSTAAPPLLPPLRFPAPTRPTATSTSVLSQLAPHMPIPQPSSAASSASVPSHSVSSFPNSQAPTPTASAGWPEDVWPPVPPPSPSLLPTAERAPPSPSHDKPSSPPLATPAPTIATLPLVATAQAESVSRHQLRIIEDDDDDDESRGNGEHGDKDISAERPGVNTAAARNLAKALAAIQTTRKTVNEASPRTPSPTLRTPLVPPPQPPPPPLLPHPPPLGSSEPSFIPSSVPSEEWASPPTLGTVVRSNTGDRPFDAEPLASVGTNRVLNPLLSPQSMGLHAPPLAARYISLDDLKSSGQKSYLDYTAQFGKAAASRRSGKKAPAADACDDAVLRQARAELWHGSTTGSGDSGAGSSSHGRSSAKRGNGHGKGRNPFFKGSPMWRAWMAKKTAARSGGAAGRKGGRSRGRGGRHGRGGARRGG